MSISESTTMRPTPMTAASRSSSTDFALPCMTMRDGSTPATNAVANSPAELTSTPAPDSVTQRATPVHNSDFAA